MWIREPYQRLLAKVKRTANWLYMLHIKLAQPSCLALHGHGDEVAWCWHERFGDVNMAALQKLAWEELVQGSLEIGQLKQLCEACQARKQRRTLFPVQAEYRAR
jgi:membrane protein required for beta-lactamase induction